MSLDRQRTLTRPLTLEGVGVHSGSDARITLLPAPPDTGIRFIRTDVEGNPEIPAHADHVVDTDRGTTLGLDGVEVRTVEHVMASLYVLGITNALVELEGPEVPIRDGSFRDYLEALTDVGVSEQEPPARVIRPTVPVVYPGVNGQSYAAVPASELRITATIEFEHPAIGRQHGSFEIDAARFGSEIARARTFGFAAEGEVLREQGLTLGASLENSVVLDDSGVVNEEGLRFEDEFLRHKIGDMVGDLALLGARLDAHVVAERPSHQGNVALARAILDSERTHARTPVVDITRIMEHLPHRYPMLLVDRITHYEAGRRIVGLKNVTINEPFFQGHYPGHPVMPGVLIVEAMAQVGGLLLMEEVEDVSDKVVYFMTLDNVKWRRPVTPGDTLVFDLEILQLRRNTCKMRGVGLVQGTVVAEAEFMARIVDK